MDALERRVYESIRDEGAALGKSDGEIVADVLYAVDEARSLFESMKDYPGFMDNLVAIRDEFERQGKKDLVAAYANVVITPSTK